MSVCDICKQPLTEDAVLCDPCCEAIARLRLVCTREPELLSSATVGQGRLEGEAAAAA